LPPSLRIVVGLSQRGNSMPVSESRCDLMLLKGGMSKEVMMEISAQIRH
jgi:hypothetical protein